MSRPRRPLRPGDVRVGADRDAVAIDGESPGAQLTQEFAQPGVGLTRLVGVIDAADPNPVGARLLPSALEPPKPKFPEPSGDSGNFKAQFLEETPKTGGRGHFAQRAGPGTVLPILG